jgi:DNA mismatch endonuclease (patch repair protein)
VFTRRRLAVFIDGCFWHGCGEHGQRPLIRNGAYWTPKIAGNVERDRRHTELLERNGWTVVRFWEHDGVDAVADAIEAILHDVSLESASEPL